MIDEAYAAAREPLEALGRAFRLALEQAKSLIVELRPEDVVDVIPMPAPLRSERIRLIEESLDILRRHLGNSLREYVFKLPSC